MKRNLKLKKWTVALLAASTVISMAGCGQSSAETGSQPQKTENVQSNEENHSSEQADSQTAPIEVTIATVDAHSGANNTGEYAEEIKNKLEEICGAKMSIDYMQDADNQTALMLAKPDTMPMMIVHWNLLKGSIVSAAQNGAFVDLNDYIWDEEKYPYLSQINQNVAASLSVDGKLIAIPRTRVIGRNGLSYRKDWAEKVGITEDPKTIEDVYNMLYKFTYEDPDGNGVDDTYGLEMTKYTGDFDIIQTWFGVGNGWVEEDGKLIPVHMQKEYMDALNWLHKIYEEGLMPSDWAVRESLSDATKTGECGVIVDVMDNGRRIWDYFVAEGTYTPSVVNPDEPASMQLVGAINGKTLATAGYNGYITLSAKTCDTPEKIEAALTMLDRFNSNEARILMTYGLEGINWEKDEDGYLVDLDKDNPDLSAGYAGFETLCPYLPAFNTPTDPDLKRTERQQAEQAVYAVNEECAVFNPASAYLTNSATYADTGSMLDEWIQQARSQYICGEIDETGLQAVWDKWYQNGGEQIIAEVNEQYQEAK